MDDETTFNLSENIPGKPSREWKKTLNQALGYHRDTPGNTLLAPGLSGDIQLVQRDVVKKHNLWPKGASFVSDLPDSILKIIDLATDKFLRTAGALTTRTSTHYTDSVVNPVTGYTDSAKLNKEKLRSALTKAINENSNDLGMQ